MRGNFTMKKKNSSPINFIIPTNNSLLTLFRVHVKTIALQRSHFGWRAGRILTQDPSTKLSLLLANNAICMERLQRRNSHGWSTDEKPTEHPVCQRDEYKSDD